MRVPVSVVLLVGVVFASASAIRAGDEDDPCMSRWEGTSLSDNLYAIDFTTKALKLLSGSENPKLKRLLEMNLVFAAATSRQAIDHRAVLTSPFVAVNWLHSVQAATNYAKEQHLDSRPPIPREKSEPNVLENLTVAESWLSKHVKD
jgi:hypothetical protein